MAGLTAWQRSVRWYDVVLIALVIALALDVATQPHECSVRVVPLFGPDVDGPIGVGVDGARVTTTCVF